jgi:hypothetical protein
VIIDTAVHLYHTRFLGFGKVSWKSIPRFPNQSEEFLLAKVRLEIPGGATQSAKAFLVAGHIFEIDLDFVPRGLLSKRAKLLSLKLFEGYLEEENPDSPRKEPLEKVPDCLAEHLPEGGVPLVEGSFEPHGAEDIESRLAQLFPDFPASWKAVLACSDGFVTKRGIVYGLHEIREVQLGSEAWCLLGEFFVDDAHGHIGYRLSDASNAVYWLDSSCDDRHVIGVAPAEVFASLLR